MATKTQLSIAIITFNEEERLAECLQSVNFANEIIVVDSNSTDKTQSIAKQFGANIHQVPWQGFGPQKQAAIDYCTYQWVLILDADERLSQEAAKEIKEVISQNNTPYSAFAMPRQNFFLGRWIKHAGWWPDYVTRLINKERCLMNKNLVHEALEVNGKIGQLNSPLVHFATRDLDHTMQKMNRYSTAGAVEMFTRKETSSYCKALSRGLWAFFYNYTIRLGFLDGNQGFIIAVSDAANKFFKYAKLVEMRE